MPESTPYGKHGPGGRFVEETVRSFTRRFDSEPVKVELPMGTVDKRAAVALIAKGDIGTGRFTRVQEKRRSGKIEVWIYDLHAVAGAEVWTVGEEQEDPYGERVPLEPGTVVYPCPPFPWEPQEPRVRSVPDVDELPGGLESGAQRVKELKELRAKIQHDASRADEFEAAGAELEALTSAETHVERERRAEAWAQTPAGQIAQQLEEQRLMANAHEAEQLEGADEDDPQAGYVGPTDEERAAGAQRARERMQAERG